MSPWWLRPTADGSEEKSGNQAPPPAAPPADAEGPASIDQLADVETEPEPRPRKTSAAPARGPEPSERKDRRSRSGRRSTRGRGRGRSEGGEEKKPPEEDARPPEPSREGLKPGEPKATASTGVAEPKEIVINIPGLAGAAELERKLALFCDLENVALGARDSGISFDINLVLERLVEKGKIIVKKAYADWSRYSDYKRAFHEAGLELIDIPQKHYSGKNSADIKMVVDAMDLSWAKEHLDTFVLLSGDSDFSPLVAKLKENNKYVIGVGVKGSSSNLLIANCDEFIYYEDIWRDMERTPKLDHLSKKEQEVFSLMVDSMLALIRENKDVLWGSMIKQTMQRKRPSFNEGYYGYSTFSDLLEDAEKKKIVKLKKDQRSGSYIVMGFASSRR